MKQEIFLAIGLVIVLGMATWLHATPEGTSDPANLDRGEAQIVLKTEKAKKPAVFPHYQHQDRLECAFCHESADYPTEWTKDTGHGFCKDCHKQNKAPKKCSTCHPKTKKRAYEGC